MHTTRATPSVRDVPVFLSYVCAMWQPVWRAKVDSFSTVKACIEARVVGIWEGNYERSLLVHQPVHWDPACLQGNTLAIRCYYASGQLQTHVINIIIVIMMIIIMLGQTYVMARNTLCRMTQSATCCQYFQLQTLILLMQQGSRSTVYCQDVYLQIHGRHHGDQGVHEIWCSLKQVRQSILHGLLQCRGSIRRHSIPHLPATSHRLSCMQQRTMHSGKKTRPTQVLLTGLHSCDTAS